MTKCNTLCNIKLYNVLGDINDKNKKTFLNSKIDDKPSGFSSKWIKEILKTEWRFDGVVFSDDLSMNGAHFIENNIERVRLSLESGCDMVLICNHTEFINEVIDLEWRCSEKLVSMKGMKMIDFCRMSRAKCNFHFSY